MIKKEDIRTLEEILNRYKKIVCNGKEPLETQELVTFAEQAIDNLNKEVYHEFAANYRKLKNIRV